MFYKGKHVGDAATCRCRASTTCSTRRWPSPRAPRAASTRSRPPRRSAVHRRRPAHDRDRASSTARPSSTTTATTRPRSARRSRPLRERYKPKRLICVFQPHQHSRTRFLLDDFATSFAAADETIVPGHLLRPRQRGRAAARQRADLVDRINEQRPASAMHLPKFRRDRRAPAQRKSREGDLIVTMGAGNVWEIGRDLIVVELSASECVERHA